jgi:hypothetical protein
MSDIIEELLGSFQSSSEKLTKLSEGLEILQNGQILVEKLSSNLGAAAQSLDGTARSHQKFIENAILTNGQLAEVIDVLKSLDTESINVSLAEIVSGINDNKSKIIELSNALIASNEKAADTQSQLDNIYDQVQSVLTASASQSNQLYEAQNAIINQTNEIARISAGHYKSVLLLLFVLVSLAIAITAKLFQFLPI